MSNDGKLRYTKGHSLTDLGNAKRLVGLFGPIIHFCEERKHWLLWREDKWCWDSGSAIKNMAKSTVRSIDHEAANADSQTVRDALSSWARASGNVNRIMAMIKLAQSELKIPISASQLDLNKSLFAVGNGVIDLETGKFGDPKSEYLITRYSSVQYDSEAHAPNWETFIYEICNGDEQLIQYLQRIIGYIMTGKTDEQCMFILLGGGANGKSVFVRIIQELLGRYAVTTPAETLMARRNDGGPSPDLARLPGTRLVVASEPDEDCILAEATVKRITGQDVIACRNLYENIFEFVPQFKLILVTNHKPIVRGQDRAIWRRLQIIPFNYSVPEEKQNPNLIETLKAELPGILNWAINGSMAYQRDRLSAPKIVQATTQEYREDMDVLGSWISESCDQDPAAETSMKLLYDSYSKWCDANGLKPMSNIALGRKLKQRGYESTPSRNGVIYQGVRIRNNAIGEVDLKLAVSTA